MVKRIVNKINEFLNHRNSEAYVKYLREKGIKIGENTYFQNPRDTHIDITRPSLVTIGDNCFFNKNFDLLTHDWVSLVFRNSNRDFINSSGRVSIGNNVSFGQNVIVTKNVTIGDNCFIGVNSLVSKPIPSNSIAVGSPAKVIMTIEEYYQKRLAVRESEALDYARSISERFGRRPVPADFWEEFPLFVSGNEIDAYPDIPIRSQLGPTYSSYVRNHVAKYKTFDDFLKAANI
ncbi:MAG: acyltransferase [Bacteroides sp.]|nr:acyltransferase [Bacteroides sp.]